MKQASCQNNEVNNRENFLFFKRLILKQEVMPVRGRNQQNIFIQKSLKNTRNELIVHWTTDIKQEKEIRIMTHKAVNITTSILLPNDLYEELKNGSQEERDEYLTDFFTDNDLECFELQFTDRAVDLSKE